MSNTVGPMKSLCGERVADWQHKLSSLGLQCVELTGDSDLSDFTSLHHVQLICTTPVSGMSFPIGCAGVILLMFFREMFDCSSL